MNTNILQKYWENRHINSPKKSARTPVEQNHGFGQPLQASTSSLLYSTFLKQNEPKYSTKTLGESSQKFYHQNSRPAPVEQNHGFGQPLQASTSSLLYSTSLKQNEYKYSTKILGESPHKFSPKIRAQPLWSRTWLWPTFQASTSSTLIL